MKRVSRQKLAQRRQMQEGDYGSQQVRIMDRAMGSRKCPLCLVIGSALDETTCSNCGRSGCAFCVNEMKRCQQCRKVAT